MSKRYDAADIEVLSGLEPVRRRPGMYTDTSRPNHLAHEVVGFPTPGRDGVQVDFASVVMKCFRQYSAGLLPWFASLDRQMYYFYAVPMAPFLVMGVALVLGDILDKNLRRGLVLTDGDVLPFFTRPMSAILAALVI